MTEYGITTSKAKYWLHVCPKDACFYWYKRELMLNNYLNFEKKEIKTAIGYLIPLYRTLIEFNKSQNIQGFIHTCNVGYEFINNWSWAANTDAEIGKMAEQCFKEACRIGIFKFPVEIIHEYTVDDGQYDGMDFKMQMTGREANIEIKGDMPGGLWGTTNIFVQTHESQHTEERK